jgi:hypothetical protein
MSKEKVVTLSVAEWPDNDLAIHCPLRKVEAHLKDHIFDEQVIMDFMGKITRNGEKYDLYACNECGLQILVKVLGIGFYEI